MTTLDQDRIQGLIARLGLTEEPMGLFYTDREPETGLSPKPAPLPTREKEMRNEINWGDVFGNFSCFLGSIRRARSKKTAAYIGYDRFGCPGAAFWLGFIKPQTETIIHYVSSGVPGQMEGELYCDSPDHLRDIFEFIDPRPAPKQFVVVKPISQFKAGETPELVIFFTRPESLCGLHQLATFVTNDPEAVASPWTAACGSLGAWPLRYLQKGLNKAVVGGWDPSARKFYKIDELSFTVPMNMFAQMCERYEESFLTAKTWDTVRKKIEKSKSVWKETS